MKGWLGGEGAAGAGRASGRGAKLGLMHLRRDNGSVAVRKRCKPEPADPIVPRQSEGMIAQTDAVVAPTAAVGLMRNKTAKPLIFQQQHVFLDRTPCAARDLGCAQELSLGSG